MIDFTKDEYDAVCHMMDRLRSICLMRHACAECPLLDRLRETCTAALLHMNIMDFEHRNKNER